jgi:hypothetical protein
MYLSGPWPRSGRARCPLHDGALAKRSSRAPTVQDVGRQVALGRGVVKRQRAASYDLRHVAGDRGCSYRGHRLRGRARGCTEGVPSPRTRRRHAPGIRALGRRAAALDHLRHASDTADRVLPTLRVGSWQGCLGGGEGLDKGPPRDAPWLTQWRGIAPPRTSGHLQGGLSRGCYASRLRPRPTVSPP